MKVIIAYPPLDRSKGIPLLSQNRQFQYFAKPTYIYPVVPAQAATLLKKEGFDVVWLDCIAEGISMDDFLKIISEEKPDVIAFETKTPVIKQHWSIIDKLKELNLNLKIVLFGDHPTALPEESFNESKVDFVLTGGDYDFLLLNLCKFLKDPSCSLGAGIYYRDKDSIKNTGDFKLDHDLDNLPFIDRDLTKWQLYAYQNGNYKRTPGSYIMSGRDCWWRAGGGCSFCSWTTLYPSFRVRSVENVLDEIGLLINKYDIKELMDDSGTFPKGSWLREFCNGMIQRGYNKKLYIDCNMRFGACSLEDYKLMKEAGFRLLLFGLESANQNTLDRVNKNLKLDQIIESCKLARRAGLFPHITIMFGYPWESYKDALNTLKLGRMLLNKGYAYTMQATVVIPYPGSSLFNSCKQEGLLRSPNWDDYDMRMPIMKTSIPDEALMKFVRGMYSVAFNPLFLYQRIKSVTDLDDLKYFMRTGKKVFGHLVDFRSR